MKRWFSFLCLLALLLSSLPHAVEAQAVNSFGDPSSAVEVTLNGSPFSSNVPAVLKDGRTLVPVRAFCEALGCTVLWLPDARQAVIFDGSHTVALPLGSPEALVDGVPVPLPGGAGAQLLSFGGTGYTFVPLRFLVETLGGEVVWDGSAHVSLAPPSRPRFTVAIDAGHGGTAFGAVYGGYKEKDLVLPIALRTAELLRQAGIGVLLTRSGDEAVGLYERANMANAAGVDLFLSIHANAAPSNFLFSGTFTYSYPGSAAGGRVSQFVQSAFCARAGTLDHGVLTENFVVLRETKMPAALLETGFMSCPEELARLADPAVQNTMAQGAAEGILNFLA